MQASEEEQQRKGKWGQKAGDYEGRGRGEEGTEEEEEEKAIAENLLIGKVDDGNCKKSLHDHYPRPVLFHCRSQFSPKHFR